MKTKIDLKKTSTIAIITILTLSILLAAAPMASAAAGSGTATIDPVADVYAGGSGTWTIEYTATEAIPIGGGIKITIPTDWTAPSLTETEAGYVTAEISTTGATVTPAVSGQVITVTTAGADMAVDDTITVVYGDTTTSSDAVATAQSTAQAGVKFKVESSLDGSTFAEIEVSPTVNVVAAADHFTITGYPTICTKNVAWTAPVTVKVYDSSNRLMPSYTGTVTWTSSDTATGVTLPADYTFGTDAPNEDSHDFTASDFKLMTFGTQTITVTDDVTSQESDQIIVSDPESVLTSIVIKDYPLIVTKEASFLITVELYDQDDNLKVDYDGAVTITSTDPLATVEGAPIPYKYTFIPTTDYGKHDFSITFNTFGAQTITVSRDTISSESNPITVGIESGISGIHGNVGDEVTVWGDKDSLAPPKTPGGLLNVYWDEVHDWDATTGTGLLATTYAKADLSFKVTITIPDAVASPLSPHTILIYDDMDKSLLKPLTEFYVDPEIVLDPKAGIVGDTITVTGTGFSADSTITVTTAPDMGTTTAPITTLPTSPSTVKTDDFGSFTCSFKIPTGTAGKIYTIKATVKEDSSITASAKLKVGTCITLTPDEGLPGTEVTILGRAFTPGETVDVRWMFNGIYITVVDDYPIDSTGTFTTTFTVPLVDTKDYTVKAIDSKDKWAEATFTVKGVTKITLDPKTGLVGDTFTVEGVWFTPSSTVDITFDGTVLATGVATDSKGGFTESVEVPDVAIGSYTVKAIDEEGVYATATFTVAPKVTTVETRLTEYLQGDVISFYINSTVEFNVETKEPLKYYPIVVSIVDPSGIPFATRDLVPEEVDGVWVVSYENASFPALPNDASLGLWNWTAKYTLTGQSETTVNGNFTVVARPTLATILDRLDELDATLAGLVNVEGNIKAYIDTSLGPVIADLDAIDGEIVSIGDNVVEIKSKVGTIEGKVTSIDDGVATVSTKVGDVKADVSDIKGYFPIEVPMPDMTPIWIAVVLSLIAALAAIASVVTITRKIAG